MAAPVRHVLLVSFVSAEVAVEIPFLFHEAGAEVTVFCNKKSWLLKNSFWDQWIECKSSVMSECVVALCTHLAAHTYDYVMLADERTLHAANEYITDEKMARLFFPIDDLDKRDALASKAGFSCVCATQHVLTPPFAIYKEGDDAAACASCITFPLLLKTEIGGGGKGVFLCPDQTHLDAQLQRLTTDQKKNLVFQKYIQGETISVEALFLHGKLMAYASSRTLSTVGTEFNVSREREYFYDPAVEKELHAAGAALTIHGFASMTYLYDKETGRYFLVEADLRANVWFQLDSLVGVDFSEALCAFLAGQFLCIRPALTESQTVHLRHFYRDVICCFERGDFIGILAWIVNRDHRWRCIPFYDKKLLMAMCVEIVRACTYRMKRYVQDHTGCLT